MGVLRSPTGRKHALVLLSLLLLLLCNFSVLARGRDANIVGTGGDDVGGGGAGGEQKPGRHRKGKKGGGGHAGGKKVKPRLSQETILGSYGTVLPAFSFDYTEYIAGAVIERSALSDNLYLSMFFVGHRSVSHDWPFDMISTDEEVMYSWGKAAKNWNQTSTLRYHRLVHGQGQGQGQGGPMDTDGVGGADTTTTATATATAARTGVDTGLAAEGHRSGILCIMQSEGMHKTYTAPAHWIAHSDPATDSDSTPFTGTFEILRCPIRGNNRAIYDTLSRSDEALLVDLVRVKERKHSPAATAAAAAGGSFGSSGSSGSSGSLRGRLGDHRDGNAHRRTLSSSSSSSSSASASNDDRFDAVQQSQDQALADRITSHRNVLISFSVPWRTRQAGYGVNFHMNSQAGNYNLWQDQSNVASTVSAQIPGVGVSIGVGATGVKKSSKLPANDPSTSAASAADGGARSGVHICVPSVRPLHPHRAEVGLPMLLEFVEHHISLGVDHIFLGMALDWASPSMQKHLAVLKDFIASGKVSVSSLSLKGYDDAMGFAGVKLSDKYAALFFVNQCLYLSKGVSDYVIPMKPSQFLQLEPKTTLAEAVASMEAGSLASPSHTREREREQLCSTAIPMYFVPDPKGTFGGWGPADNTFIPDFFKFSKMFGPLSESLDIPSVDRLTHQILPTRHVWLAAGHTSMVCGSGHSYIPSYAKSPHARRFAPPTATHGGGKEKVPPQPSGASWASGRASMATPSAEAALSLYHFVERLPVGGYLPSGTPFREGLGSGSGLGSDAQFIAKGSAKRATGSSVSSSSSSEDALQAKNGAAAGSASLYWDLKRVWERLESKGLGTVSDIEKYIQQQQQQQQQQSPHDIVADKDKDKDGAAPRPASAMAAPFWLATDTAHLYDILVRVFPQGH